MSAVGEHEPRIEEFDRMDGVWVGASRWRQSRAYLACSCGYCGPCRESVGLAIADRDAHLRAAAA